MQKSISKYSILAYLFVYFCLRLSQLVEFFIERAHLRPLIEFISHTHTHTVGAILFFPLILTLMELASVRAHNKRAQETSKSNLNKE